VDLEAVGSEIGSEALAVSIREELGDLYRDGDDLSAREGLERREWSGDIGPARLLGIIEPEENVRINRITGTSAIVAVGWAILRSM